LKELKSRKGPYGIKKDLELENWPDGKISILIRRIRELYNERPIAKKGPYSPTENAIVDRKIALFLKVLFKYNIANIIRLGKWIKPTSHDLWQKIQN